MNPILKCGGVLWLSAAGLLAQGTDWARELRPALAGTFPEVTPFRANFAFGWSGIQAASGEASLSHEGSNFRVKVRGGTEGWVAELWQLKVESDLLARRDQMISVELKQREFYKKYRLEMTGLFQTDGIWRQRLRLLSSDPGGWKFLRVAPIRDMASAMMFVRSQPLLDGDEITLLAFPGDSPYRVRVIVEGRETQRAMNQNFPAIRLRLFLQKIETSGPNKGKLQAHSKFRSGVVWVSDDTNRFPLRAEVNLFIGYVYAELVKIEWDLPKKTPGSNESRASELK